MANPEKINFREAFRAYPKALKEGITVWKTVPRSMFFVFLSELIMRFSFSMSQVLFLVYAFYVLKIGGTPNPNVYRPEEDPALQQARIMWGYVMIALFICNIILSFPVGKLIDKVGRKIPLIISSLLTIPAVLLFIFGNYLTLFITMPLIGFSMLLGFSSYQAMFADLVPQAQRGKVTGSMNFFAYIFMAVGGAVGGILYDSVSPLLPFILMAILAIPSAALIMFGVREPKPEEREA